MKSLLPLFRFAIPFRPDVRNYLYHSPNPSMDIEKNSLYPLFFNKNLKNAQGCNVTLSLLTN